MKPAKPKKPCTIKHRCGCQSKARGWITPDIVPASTTTGSYANAVTYRVLGMQAC